MEEFEGYFFLINCSIWCQFEMVSNVRWSTGNVVLIGDVVHTVHFLVGSGIKMAMEDSIVFIDAFVAYADLGEVLVVYEVARRFVVESTQWVAAVSFEWFESIE